MVSKNMFAFQKIAGEQTCETVFRVADVVVDSGLAIRAGKITNGSNMDTVKKAVYAIDELPLRREEQSGYISIRTAAHLVRAMKKYIENAKQEHLEEAAAYAVFLKTKIGWSTKASPNNNDTNANGTKMHGYKEPEGVALEFAKAFCMLPESSPNYVRRQPQTGHSPARISAQLSLAGKGLRHRKL